MPDYCPRPIHTDDELNVRNYAIHVGSANLAFLCQDWLKFFQLSAPLTFMSTLISNDPGLDMRPQHAHGFGEAAEGGHYHYDTTPDDVDYLAYYNVAETIYRVDAPVDTHMVGRD